MKKILVMQLFRFGDILQTTPALTVLRKTYPHARISILVRLSFAETIRDNPDVDEIIPWDIGPQYDRILPGSPMESEAAGELRAFLAPLRSRRFDLVCNLSNDLPSALIAYLLRPRQAIGLVFCRDRQYRVRGDWLRYLFITNEARRLNTINVADCFAMACGGGPAGRPTLPLTSEAGEAAERLLRDALPGPRRPLVAVQAGASKDYKRWPAPHFARLTERLVGEGYDVVFLGSSEERRQIGQIAENLDVPANRVANLAGRTTLGELGAILRRSRLLVSNDTATIHAASAVGTRSLVLAFGPTGAYETGPLGEGNYVLTPRTACHPCNWNARCREMPCRDDLTTDCVAAAVACAFSDGRVIPDALRRGDVVLYRSEVMPDGLAGLRPVNRPEMTFGDFLRMAYRTYSIRHWTGSEGERSIPEWRPWVGEMHTWFCRADVEGLKYTARMAVGDFAMLRKLAEMGAKAANAVALAGTATVCGRLGEALGKLEQRVLASEQNEVISLLVSAFRHNLRDMESLPLQQEAVAHRWNYFNMARGCEYMERALEEFVRALGAAGGPAGALQASRTRTAPSAAIPEKEVCVAGRGAP